MQEQGAGAGVGADLSIFLILRIVPLPPMIVRPHRVLVSHPGQLLSEITAVESSRTQVKDEIDHWAQTS